ncbi:hypothetical protein PT974_05151 [Cladobotryum mycophilum]|uniref:LDB19 N-terminal domain-containing protein n=1 Tax=Cladobotryum mycophilum TaxID=491253 RepID=A0ABR0SSC2_9HYPO
MPHLVSNFLRSSTGNITGIKNATVSRSRNGSRATSGNTSRNPSPHASASSSSDNEDQHAVKMPDLVDALKKHHRLSLHFGWPSSSSSKEQQQAYSPATVDWTLESPPIILHGAPDESTGALVAGQLFLDIKEDVLDVESFSASLNLVVSHKRPFQNNCSDCQTQTTVLEAWKFLSHPTALRNGKHQFPFSVHLKGHLPASTDTPIVTISYVLKAEAVVARSSSHSTGTSTSTIKFERTLDVKRSLPEPLYPHNSAAASYMSVIHPAGGNNKMTFKLDGLLTHNEKVGTVDLWRLKKLTWRLEETIKAVAPACEKHNPGPAESANKSLPRSETRVIGEKSLHEGWKSDYTGNDGTVDVEFDFCVNQLKPHSSELKYACDLKTDEGTVISHSLCLELVVSKEYAQEGKTHLSHQTGTGRILRMHFAVILTHNAGMGLSWDNEAPPVYEDVPPSPPQYMFDDDPIEYDDLEAATAPNSRRPSRGDL